MREASDALIALLHSSEQFTMVDLYTIPLLQGGVLRYSSGATG
jgi:hypothetical protein